MNQAHKTEAQTSQTGLRPIALREAETPEQKRLLADYLSRVGDREVVQFATYHDDRLDAHVREGRFDQVIFANLDALLVPVWKGYLHLDVWLEAGVSIELLDSPVAADHLRGLLAQIHASHTRFRRKLRKRQTLAAVVLGVLALVAMAAMIWLIPQAR